MKNTRAYGFALAAIAALPAALLLFTGAQAGGAAAGTQPAYVVRAHILAVKPLSGAEQEASVGYRAYIPAKKKSNAIVILVSGWTCGPAWLHYVAACLAGQHGTEAWTVRRRMAFFENRSAWNADLAALRLDRLQKIENYFTGSDPRELNNIGYGVLLDDLDAVVREARTSASGSQARKDRSIPAAARTSASGSQARKDNGGKRNKEQPVILGGWSDGAEFVMAYAHRQFADGKRGHERLAGLLLIDENSEWGTHPPDAMRRELAKKRALAEAYIYERRSPAVTVFEAIGAHASAARMAARLAASAQDKPPAPAASPFAAFFPQRPRAEMTDAALMGWLYDGAGTGKSAWGWLVSAGGLDNNVQPADWKNGGNTPIERLEMIHAHPDGVWEWFYPHRIGVDFWEIGVSGFQHEGLRIAPDRNNRLPVFAVLSGFNKGVGVPPGIRWWLERTGIQDDQIALHRYDHFRHADVLLAPAAEEEIWAKFAAWVGAQ